MRKNYIMNKRYQFTAVASLLLSVALGMQMQGCAEDAPIPTDARAGRDVPTGRDVPSGSMDVQEFDQPNQMAGDTGVADDSGSNGMDAMGATDIPNPPPRDVPTDTGRCTAGSVICVAADRSSTCLPDGTRMEMDCPMGQVCADGRGCTVCEPGSQRCNADGLTVERCAMDGMSWAMSERCNAAMGLACEGFRCVNLCDRAASQRSYLGCEYWPTVTPNPAMAPFGGTFNFGVTVANPQDFPVTVTISGGALAAPRTVMVGPNTTRTETLPWVAALYQHPANQANSAVVRNGAYRLVSNAPIAVYQFNPLEFTNGGGFSYSNDASLLLPTHVLTGNYMVITHNSWVSFGGFSAIVATEDNTMVTSTLRSGLRPGAGVAGNAGQAINHMLNRGDVLLLVASGTSGNGACAAEDLTGTTVSANHPVAVFGGHACTNMPCASVACDHLEEQMFPTETWGTNYIVSGLRERGAGEPSVVRILSRTAGNMLTFTGMARPAGCPAALGAGQFCEFEAVPDFQVQGTAPLLIAQFMVGQGRFNGVGDPAMVLEVPTQQFRSDYVFNVPGSYTQNFLTVTYNTMGGVPQLDGRPVTAGVAVAGTPYSVTRQAITPGSHRMNGGAAFGIKVTGTASYTSYMYPGGLDLNQLTAM